VFPDPKAAEAISTPDPDEGPLPRYLLPDNAAITSDGRVSIAGVDLLELVAEVGTPVFVYDEQHIRTRCREAVDAFGGSVAYASKAFLCKAMARLAHEEGMAIDVSTGGEIHVALQAGVPGDRLVVHGNNKSADELSAAIAAGAGRIVVDSFDEITRLEKLMTTNRPVARKAAGERTRVLVRVNPGIEAHTHEYLMTGHDDSKFGFSLATGAAEEAVARLRAMHGFIEVVGLHAHIGSQIFWLNSFERLIESLTEVFSLLNLHELCIGGGLGVAYVSGESAPTIGEWAHSIQAAAKRFGLDPSVRISAEPGRAIVAQAAITCYTVGTIKHTSGRTFISVDGGMSDNPRPVLYGSGYEAFVVSAALAPRPCRAAVVGKHCESGDVIVRDARLPEAVQVGDILATPVTGAYGHSMASNYNKVPRPPVVFVRDGRYRVVVRRESFDDLLVADVGP
jgi:diaminopimelate decarboxylase